MNSRNAAMNEIVRKVVADFDREQRQAELAEPVAVSGHAERAILKIAREVTPTEWGNRQMKFRPTIGNRGEHSRYDDGDVLLNDPEKSRVKADFLVCAEWTGDCHHKFLPVSVDPQTGELNVQKEIHGYESFGRPLFALKTTPGVLIPKE